MEENQIHIPEGWKLNKLGSVCRIKKGVQFNKIELSDAGMYPCINGGIEPSGFSDLWNTDKNTITISEGGNSCGYVNFIETKFWSGGHCYSLLDLSSDMENDFLYQALKGRQNLIMDLRVGSGLPNIQQKAIKEFEFLSPDNKPEQTQIATILSKVDEAITQTQQLIAKYTRIKTGLMQDLLTKGIDENGNIRSEVTHEFKDSPLGRIPKEWDDTNLSFFIDKLESGVSVNSDDSPIGGNQLGVLKTSALSNHKFNHKQNKTVKSFDISRLKCPVRKGAILISRMNTPDLVGENALVKDNYENLYLPDRIWQTIFKNTEELNIEWLAIILKSEVYRKKIAFLGTGTSNSMKNISKKSFLEISIPKIPVAEQLKISNKILALESFENSNINQLSKLQSLKTGLMQDLLSGKVRVNHLIKEIANV